MISVSFSVQGNLKSRKGWKLGQRFLYPMPMIFLYSRYVAFALFFIMFGLAIIAASLNLMVLKFMTLNTEDEKRDEQQAIQVRKWQFFRQPVLVITTGLFFGQYFGN